MMKRTQFRLSLLLRRGKGLYRPGGDVISPSDYKFYVDWSRLDAEFEKCLAGERHIYCSGSVREGKSSWAKSYAEDDKNKACFLPFNELDDVDDNKVCDAMLRELQKKWPQFELNEIEDVISIPQDYTLLFDESHLLFKWLDKRLGQYFVKRTSLRCRVAFLSTTAAGLSAAGIITPAQVTNKVVLPWRFTREEVAALIPSMLAQEFDGMTTFDDEDVIDALFSLFCGHRGMTVMALNYISDQMKAAKLSGAKLSRELCHRYLCEMLRLNEGSLESRASSINSGIGGTPFPYNPVYNKNIQTVMELAVSKGEVSAEVAIQVSRDIARCVTLGALVPKEMWEYPPTSVGFKIKHPSAYCVPNPFLLRGLATIIGLNKKRLTPKATLPVEAVLTGISHLQYDALFCTAGDNTVSTTGVWFEDPLNEAIKDGINLAYAPSSTAVASTEEGKPDIIFEDFVIEGVVYYSDSSDDAKDHYNRFWNRKEYKRAGEQVRGGLLVVYCSGSELVDAKQYVESIVEEKVPILLVVISFHSLWSFETHFIQKRPAPGSTTTTVKTDLSVYKFDVTHRKFVPSQEIEPEFEKKLAALKPIPVPVAFWAQSKSGGPAFKVTPATNDIDSLKEAIKAKWESNYGTKINALTLVILDPDTKKPVAKQSTALKPNTEEDPYLFVLPEL